MANFGCWLGLYHLFAFSTPCHPSQSSKKLIEPQHLPSLQAILRSYRWSTELCQCAEGCLPAPTPTPALTFWNEPPASTHRCFLCSFLLAVFSAQLGFPSRWLRAQPNLLIHSSKTLGGGQGSLGDLGPPSPTPPRGDYWHLIGSS